MNKNNITLQYLEEVRKRCEDATQGPWISFIEGRDHESGDNFIMRGPDGSGTDLYLNGGSIADHDFVAHSRQDIPILLDEIKRLKSLLSGS